MPAHPGKMSPGAGQGLAAPALANQGIPQGVLPAMNAAPDSEALSEIVAMLRGGQAGAERMMQLLSLLASATVPQMQGGQGPQQQRGAGGAPNIQQLLGG